MRYSFLFILFIILLFSACRHSETERRTDFKVHGIDVSHYQQDINWDTVAKQSIDFVFVKATEGESYKDSIFAHNWKEIKRVGLRRGAYHFFTPSVPPTKQFENFKNSVILETGDLPPVLDFEQTGKKNKKEIRKSVKKWLYLAENHYKIRPIIYTNQKFYHSHIKGHFPHHIVWIARYNTIPPDMPVSQDWTFWQYGDKGNIEGIKGDVDFNVFKGDIQKLDKLLFPPPPNPPTKKDVNSS